MDMKLLATLRRVGTHADRMAAAGQRVGDGSNEAFMLASSSLDALDHLGVAIDADRQKKCPVTQPAHSGPAQSQAALPWQPIELLGTVSDALPADVRRGKRVVMIWLRAPYSTYMLARWHEAWGMWIPHDDRPSENDEVHGVGILVPEFFFYVTPPSGDLETSAAASSHVSA